MYENGELAVRYGYDSIGRLIREDNKALDKSEIISYDNKGNIIKRREYGFTLKDNTQIEEEKEISVKEYSYAGDEMKTCGGEICEYDVIGNPTTYRGKKATWTNGRFLNSYNNVAFSYDGLGRRIKKGNISYTYDSQGRLLKQSNGLEFLYDHSGVFAVKNGETTYFYRKDAQSNITAIIDSEGSVVARYLYNAWGEVSVVDNTGKEITDKENIANLNPYRYRSYYYDTETGLYYLKTRYYDPQVGRFMTIDGIEYLDLESINGLNLYSYCLNNPIFYVDPDGHAPIPWWGKLLIGIGVVLVGAVVTALTAGTGAGFMAAFGAALLTSAKAVAISTAISAGIGLAVGGITTGTWEGAFNGMLDGAVDGFMWGGIFAGGAQVLSGVFKGVATIANKAGKLQTLKQSPIFSPDRLKDAKEIAGILKKGQKFYDYGGTLVRFGKFAHIDVSTKALLHLAAFGFKHIPIGTVIAGIIGGF